MLLILIFFAIPVLALCYTVCVVSRRGEVKMSDCVTPLPPMPFDLRTNLVQYPRKAREIKWISTKEFETLLRSSEEVIFIDLRSHLRREPLGIVAKTS